MKDIKVEVKEEEETLDHCVFPTDGSSKRNPPERCPRPLYSRDPTQEDLTLPHHDQYLRSDKDTGPPSPTFCEDRVNMKAESKAEEEEEEIDVRGNHQPMEEAGMMMMMTEKEEESSLDITDGSTDEEPPERCPRPLYSRDPTQEDLTVPHQDQGEEMEDIKVEVIKEEELTLVSGAQQSMEEGEVNMESEQEESSLHMDTRAAKTENGISNLKKFPKLDFQSKQRVISHGRPMPVLLSTDLLQTRGQKKITRSFQMEWYQRKDWLCGCATKNRLYCFPCLLFSSTNNVWTNAGFCDLKNLSRGLCKHEKSATHIQSQIALKTFGTSRIDLALNQQRGLNISIHNAQVKENREILKHLIDATCFLAKQQLAFRGGGHDEGARSWNRGNYVELLHAFAERDERLAKHLETSAVFSGLHRMQNDLIDAVAEVIRNDIRKEIDAAAFVAVEVDETTDVTNKARLSVVMHYVAIGEATCEVKEAFLGFDDVSDRRAPAVAEYVFRTLKRYDCVEKLVSQSYDGAAVMAADLHTVRAAIQDAVPEAAFIHCYAHNLNLVLMHSAKCIPECKTFFKMVEGLAAFFSKSTQRTRLLDEVAKRRSPRAAPARWSSNASLVQTIGAYHSDLRAAFRIVSANPDGWDNETLMMAVGYDLWLSEASTCFLIMAYECVFNETDALFRLLQSKVTDLGLCCERIRDAMGFVERQGQEFDRFYDRFQQKCAALGLKDGDPTQQPIRDERKATFHNILDNVGLQMKARFDQFGELAFAGFVDCAKFGQMSQHLDDPKLQSLSTYARYFDFVRLKADLVGLYGSQEVRNKCKSPGQLLGFLVQNDLMQTVPEATKLLQLVLTIPAMTASVERSLSALKRLRAYGRNRSDRGQLASLAIVSIEAERLLRLRENKEDFYSKVTEIFVQKDRRTDFIYK